MTSPKQPLRFAMLALAAATLATGVGVALPQPAPAQSGLTIFGGVAPEFRLRYLIDFNRPRSRNSRYYLQVARAMVTQDIVSFEIEYPESFTERRGRLDMNAIELRQGDWRGGAVIPVQSIEWEEGSGRIVITPEEPIPANSNFVIVMSNVVNPNRYGYHYFNLNAMFQGDVIGRYVGTWPLELGAD
ncbi:hypothetical protein GFS31_26360 [Leptolyngbya sp. BL0902]|uniref:DUF2808 domain-containing protein n=1 Tax=Leptolyngbya sp. BL0902 TaxID=1115757 RepID=UPI0018E8DB9A|nr:DUF2808 domain-containing protein [Leptolyngbya sp. BL0902]QQE65944.1 hypothetical protein GFS31_26360 [Leptolyngbya sp. BL0902]